MNKRAVVITKDKYLAQKIKLALADTVSVYPMSELDKGHFDICFYDMRWEIALPEGVQIIRVGDGGELGYPFSFEELKDALALGRTESKPLLKGDGCAIVRGERIKLTDVEYALFELLYNAGGEYVSREEMLEVVWGGRADKGVVNVYVHYLRNKLEKGEKIILSSRNLGYKIDEKHLK